MTKGYKTVCKYATEEIEEKKSKFIASVKPILNEDEAIEFINKIKSKYYDATHNVYCYDVLNQAVIQRFSDDKEPQGTAGLPILELIKKMEIRNIVIVVTRYFGGTLLGAAGLVKAYTKSALAGIETAGIINKVYCYESVIQFEYSFLGKINSLITSSGYKIKDTIYSEYVKMIVFVPIEEARKFTVSLDEISNGSISPEFIGKGYIIL